jgi:hypothetical protein
LQEYLLPKLSRKEITDKSEDNNKLTIRIVRPEPDYSKLTVEELKILKGLIEKVETFDKPILEEE